MRTIKLALLLLPAVLTVACTMEGEPAYTPLHPTDFQLPAGASSVTVGNTADGTTTNYFFNKDSLLTARVVSNIADDIIASDNYTYSGKRLEQMTDFDGNRYEAQYEYDTIAGIDRLATLKSDNRMIRYCYNSELSQRVDTIKVYNVVDGEREAEPIYRTDFTYANGGTLSGKWERDFTTNRVEYTQYNNDGHTPSLRKHYVNGKIQGYRSGNTVYHSDSYTDPATGEVYYRSLTERAGSSSRGKMITRQTLDINDRNIAVAVDESVETAAVAAPVGAVSSERFVDNMDRPEAWLVGAAFILIFVLLTWWMIRFANRRWGLLRNFKGPRVPYGTMPRMWMFNYQPYVKMAGITVIIFLAFALTLALFQLMSYAAIALIWIARSAAIVILAPAMLLVWGWIIAGLLYLFSSTVRGLINKYIVWLFKLSPILIVAALMYYYEDQIMLYGDKLSLWCRTVLSGMTLEGLAAHWRLVLAVILAPATIFLAIALGTIALTGVLVAAEWLVMKFYRVHRRCPQCNCEDFNYIVRGKVYPVGLHPGVYGVLHHTYEGERLPTMLALGKGRLTRRCTKCGHETNALKERNAFGTDVHIGFAGGPSTGKSWLIFEGLYQLRAAHTGRMRQHREKPSTSITTHHTMVQQGKDFQTVAKQYTTAVELMIDRKGQPMPWHTHWWDVAGENFDSAHTATVLSFYREVRCIALLIDPLLTLPTHAASERYTTWVKTQRGYSGRYDLNDTIAQLITIISQAGGKVGNVDIVVVLAKADLGYLDGVAHLGHYATVSEQQLESFVKQDMGLINEMLNLTNQFHSVGYAAVSVRSAATLNALFTRLLTTVGVTL